MNIIHVDLNSAHLLTAERMQPGPTGGEAPAGFLCDANGTTLPHDRRHETPRVYLDHISGTYFMMIDHEEKERIAKAGEQEIYQGTGVGMGWFVVAPDYTLIGRHGERAPKPNVTSIASSPSFEQWTAPKNYAKPLRSAPAANVASIPDAIAPARGGKRTPEQKAAAKKAIKRTATKTAA